MLKTLARAAALAAAGTAASLAHGATVDWTNWTASTSTSATGNVVAGASTVGVTFSGPIAFTQLNNTGFNYWQNPPTPYLSSEVSNAPATSDIIGLGSAGTFTITFSAPVVNPLIGLVSWNGAVVDFAGTPNLQYLSSGCGYWGCGTFANATSSSFDGSGELHGVIELQGTFSSITFTDSVDEYWHGLTVGFERVATTVPEPGSLPLMLAGLGALGLVLRRRAR
jgi:hypothetical protein